MTGDDIDPLVIFRTRLQELFVLLRRPTYRSLEAHADRDGRVLRPSTVSGLLNGPAIPRWQTVETFIRACACHAQARQIRVRPGLVDLDRWHREYRAMENALANQAARREQVAGRPVPRRRAIVPAQLPADAPAFTGRTEHLATLGKLLPDAPISGRRGGAPDTVVISAIEGTAGVGKTALAVHWAHQIRDRFPDGQLYVNLRGFDPSGRTVDADETVRGFLDALGERPEFVPVTVEARAARYRSLVSGRKVLIVLDNARDAAQVRPLLPGTPGCLVVVTSRSRLTALVAVDGAHPVGLDLLSQDEARLLLSRRLGTQRVAAEPA